VTLTAAAPEAETTIVLGLKAGVLTGQVADAATGQPLTATMELRGIDDPNRWISTALHPEYRLLIPPNVAIGLRVSGEGYEDWSPDKPLSLASGQQTVMNVRLKGIWPLVDFVAKPPIPGKNRQVANIPGQPASRNPKPAPKLPLEIRFDLITRSPVRRGIMIVQLRLRNIGTEPYLLPIGRDGDLALRPANRGRRELRFELQQHFEPEFRFSAPVSFGSADLPGSFLTILPNASVRVRFQVDVSSAMSAWERRHAVQIPVHAGCVDLRYEDNPRQIVLLQPASEAVSAEEWGMPLQPGTPQEIGPAILP
jgi:hypothetical protein